MYWTNKNLSLWLYNLIMLHLGLIEMIDLWY